MFFYKNGKLVNENIFQEISPDATEDEIRAIYKMEDAKLDEIDIIRAMYKTNNKDTKPKKYTKKIKLRKLESKDDMPKLKSKKKAGIHFDYDKLNGVNNNRKIKKLRNVLSKSVPENLEFQIVELNNGLFDFIEYDPTQNGLIIGHWLIDPGIIYGNSNYLITINNDIPIPLKETDILEKTLRGQPLTIEEIERCNNKIFTNKALYGLLDLSSNKIYHINQKQFKELEEKLNSLYALLVDLNIDNYKYRFEKAANPDKFTLISDIEIKSPLSNYYYSNIKICVDNENITILYPDGNEYHYKFQRKEV